MKWLGWIINLLWTPAPPRVEPSIAWGGDGQRDKVVHRDERGWVSRRVVMLTATELPLVCDSVSAAMVAAVMRDIAWSKQLCEEAIPELKTIENDKLRMRFAISIVEQSALAHGDKKILAYARECRKAFNGSPYAVAAR